MPIILSARPSLLLASFRAISSRIPFLDHTPRFTALNTQHLALSRVTRLIYWSTEPSEERQWQNTIAESKLDKWGWVIYRCTYKDNQAWERFKQNIIETSRRGINESDAPELADRLELTFVEDRTLEDAPMEQLRARFKEWAAHACPKGQPRAKNHASYASRYTTSSSSTRKLCAKAILSNSWTQTGSRYAKESLEIILQTTMTTTSRMNQLTAALRRTQAG